MALFEGYERRINKINETLAEYGIDNIEQAKTICDEHGINVDAIVKGIQRLPLKTLSGLIRWAAPLLSKRVQVLLRTQRRTSA